jgi:hypothetical protein
MMGFKKYISMGLINHPGQIGQAAQESDEHLGFLAIFGCPWIAYFQTKP